MIPLRFHIAGLIVLSVVACAANVAATPPTIAVTTSTNSVQVAEPFTVQWTVIAPSGSRVTFPEIGSKFAEFDILSTSDQFDLPQTDSPEMRVWRRRMILETIFTGDQQIPVLEIGVVPDGNASEDAALLRSQPTTIHVASVLEDRADPTQFRDIESVVDVDVPVVPSYDWVGWTLGGAAALTALALGGVAIHRRRRTVTAKAWALDELDELQRTLDTGPAEIEDAAQRVSAVVRNFLLLQFDTAASGDTSHEVIDEVDSRDCVDPHVIARLQELFAQADTAKFAGLQMTRSEVQAAIENARGIVQAIATADEGRRR